MSNDVLEMGNTDISSNNFKNFYIIYSCISSFAILVYSLFFYFAVIEV